MPSLSPDSNLSTATCPQPVAAGLAGKLAEACWLGAAGVIPLLMDPNAASRFLPIKTVALNALGFIAAAALLTRLLSGAPRSKSVEERWWLPVISLLAALAVSTACSVTPAESLWGGYEFLQGSVSMACQLALFAAAVVFLRTEAQIKRLAAVVVAASLPMGGYLLLQKGGLDPLASEDKSLNLHSFAGNSNFAAGLLVLAAPLAWYLVRDFFRRKAWVAAIFCCLICLLQFTAVLASGKRGAFLAFLAAVFVVVAIHFSLRRRILPLLIAAMIGLATLAGLAGLAWVSEQDSDFQKIPVVNRLSRIVPVGGKTGDSFRRDLWDEAPALVIPIKPSPLPDGKDDLWFLRPVIGYGPETLPVILPASDFIMSRGAPGKNIESRFHSLFWDLLQSIGLFGVLSLLALISFVFTGGFHSLHLPEKAIRWKRIFAAGLITGTVAGLIFGLFMSWGYFGLGFPLGALAGIVLAPLCSTWAARASANQSGADEMPVVFLMASFVAHWVDMAFLFPTPTSSGPFWVIAGAVLAMGRAGFVRDSVECSDDLEHAPKARRGLAVAVGIIAGTQLLTLVNAFLHTNPLESCTSVAIIKNSFTELRWVAQPSHLTTLLVIPCWLGGVLILSTAFSKGRVRGTTWFVGAITALPAAVAWLVWKAGLLASTASRPTPSTPFDVFENQASALELASICILAAFLAMIGMLSLTLPTNPRVFVCRRSGPFMLGAGIILLALALTGIIVSQFPLLRSEASGGLAKWFTTIQHHAAAAAMHERALNSNPRDLFNRIDGSQAHFAVAERSADVAACLQSMRRAENILARGIELEDRNILNVFLANALMRQALELPAGPEREAIGLRAAKAFKAALVYAPKSEVVWFDASMVHREILHDPGAADVLLKQADTISVNWRDPYSLGVQYAFQVGKTANPTLRIAYGRRGISCYDRAIQAALPSDARTALPLLTAKGTLLMNIGAFDDAKNCLLEAAKLGQGYDSWQAHAMLAEIFLKSGDGALAEPHLDLAILHAPAAQRSSLMALKERIRKPATRK